MEVGLALNPRHHLGVGKVAVPAKDDKGIGPGLAQVLHQPFQHRQHLRRAQAFGLEDRGNQASRDALIVDVQGQETIAVIVAIVFYTPYTLINPYFSIT